MIKSNGSDLKGSLKNLKKDSFEIVLAIKESIYRVAHIVQFLVPGLVGLNKINYGNAAPNLYSHYSGNFWNRSMNSPFMDVAPNIALGFVFMVVARLLYTRFLWLPDP